MRLKAYVKTWGVFILSGETGDAGTWLVRPDGSILSSYSKGEAEAQLARSRGMWLRVPAEVRELGTIEITLDVDADELTQTVGGIIAEMGRQLE